MAIFEFSDANTRNRIGFVGADPPDDARRVLEPTGYELVRFQLGDLGNHATVAKTAAVIFQQTREKPSAIREELEVYAPTLLWNDCRIFVRPVAATPGASEPPFRTLVVNALELLELPSSGLSDAEGNAVADDVLGEDVPSLTPVVHLLTESDVWRETAVRLRANPPGVAPYHDLEISATDPEGREFTLTEERKVLVRRAFEDCASIRLVGMANGLSGVFTFRAFAHLRSRTVGSRWPYLYFVKVGSRSKIAKEFRAYEMTALESVPYHLGPRLRRDRCALGQSEGIIVSDYVGGAEALRDCARDGRAVPAIANLFNTTLVAWRNNADVEQAPLQEFLEAEMPEAIPPHRQSLIDSYGVTASPAELRELFTQCTSNPVLVGVVHGDLHATNVLVRGADAILIDLEKVGARRPLLWDMACLEGGLLVDGFARDRRTGERVLKSVECLYDDAAFESFPDPCHPSDGSTWFFDCVRQIRMHVSQVELDARQYALALAVALARKGCNEEDFRKERRNEPKLLCREDTRALAYVLAARILTRLARRRREMTHE